MNDQRRRSRLDELSPEARAALVKRLHELQNGLCYVCGEVINPQVHRTDIDHIKALWRDGADDESNWALAHDACNRSKGARDLQLQRILHEFRRYARAYTSDEKGGSDHTFTLHNALEELRPSRQEVGIKIMGREIQVSWTHEQTPITESYLLLEEPGSPPAVSFVARLPFECLHHDHEINARSIVDLEPMIEEFYNGYPQLQPSLASLTVEGGAGRGKILVFDGQHKAAAQLFARRDRLFVRVFVNCDRERLKETNYRAHTKLAQVHFPQLINDRVGADLFREEFGRFLQLADTAKASEETFFAKHLSKDQVSDFRSYHGNFLRHEVLEGRTDGDESRVLRFTETVTARAVRYPLSYDALQRALLNTLLCLKSAREPLAETERLRQLERENLVRLLNIFVDEVLDHGRFDLQLGAYKMEERLAKDPNSVPDSHLRAYRICRKAPMAVWARELREAVKTLLTTRGRYQVASWANGRPLWAQMQPEDWTVVREMVRALRDHKVWGEVTNREIVAAFASTKQRDWEDILAMGTLPGRTERLLPPLDRTFVFQSAINAGVR